MAVPPVLPLDIVRLIFDQFWALRQVERREIARMLALVCRDWTNLARALAWHSVGLTSGDRDPLLAGLLARRHLLPYISNLQIAALCEQADTPSDTFSTDSFVRVTPQGLVDLLDGCPAVTSLTLPACLPDSPLMHALYRAAFKPILRGLMLDLYMFDPVDLDNLTRGLRSCQRLGGLTIRVIVQSEISRAAHAEGLPPPSPVESLLINLFTPKSSQRPTLNQAILDIVDPSTLTTVELEHFHGDPDILARLSAFPHLQNLYVDVGWAPDSAQPALRTLFASLSSFRSLKQFHLRGPLFHERAMYVPLVRVPSPLPLHTFLGLLPTTLKSAIVDGAFFIDGVDRLGQLGGSGSGSGSSLSGAMAIVQLWAGFDRAGGNLLLTAAFHKSFSGGAVQWFRAA